MAIKKITNLKILCCIFLFSVLSAQSTLSPSQNDWYTINNKAVSDNGKWIFLTKNFEGGGKDGVLLNSVDKKEKIIKNAGNFYLDDNYFIVLNTNNELLLKDLTTQKERIFDDTSDFEYDSVIKKLLVHQNGTLVVLDLISKKENKFSQITRFETIKNTPCTFLYSNSSVSLLNKITGESYELRNNDLQMRAFQPIPDQKQIAILLKIGDVFKLSLINYYGKQMIPPRSINFDKSFLKFNFLNSTTILASKPLLSETEKNRDTVEVWSNHDKVLKPNLMNRYANAQVFDLVDFSLKNTPLKSFNNFVTDYYLVFGGDYLLESSTLENDDFYESNSEPSPKILLRNRSTDKVEFEIDKTQLFYPSEQGKYLLYFKDRNWYLFDVTSRTTKNLTSSLNEKFFTIDRLNTKYPNPTDRVWFDKNYKTFYLASRNNIWQYSVKEKQLIKLTANSNLNTSYNITELVVGDIQSFKWNENMVVSHDDLVVKISNSENDLEEGLAILKNGKLTIVEELGSQLITNIQHSQGSLTYTIQDANNPPQFMTYAISKNIKKSVYETLHKPLPLNFPKTLLREWINKKGEKTYTTIVLPPDYSPSKKYPTIVRVYENEAKRFKAFVYPTYFNPSGFNRIILAQEGYIVILPEIKYRQNIVGRSIVESVEETLKKVESWYSVDPQNIGLIGHSFGGYETMEILTRSKLFRAAVSGSGIADIVSDYFTVHKDLKSSNISRYTNQQFGFSDSFYALKKEYLENNPILHADSINTPLLLFSGKNDNHVEWRQSVEMFMALSSLKKETHLLLFPGDAHILVHPENQIESTKRILQWFDYYLKNKERPEWF